MNLGDLDPQVSLSIASQFFLRSDIRPSNKQAIYDGDSGNGQQYREGYLDGFMDGCLALEGNDRGICSSTMDR